MELIRVQDSDYKKTYDLYMTFPENENGYMNNVYGYDYDKFLDWIEMKRNWSMGKELPEGFVADTTYVLSDEGTYVGVFNLTSPIATAANKFCDCAAYAFIPAPFVIRGM